MTSSSRFSKARIGLFATVAVAAFLAIAGTAQAVPATLFSENFGSPTGNNNTTVNMVPGGAQNDWIEGNDSPTDNCEIRQGDAGTGPTQGGQARLDQFCTLTHGVDTTGWTNIELSFSCKGDGDSNNDTPTIDDMLKVEYSTTGTGGSFTVRDSLNMWLAPDAAANCPADTTEVPNAGWSSPKAYSLPCETGNNPLFAIRFRVDADDEDEDAARIDDVLVTGDPDADGDCVADDDDTESGIIGFGDCGDGIDNDDDGNIDGADSGCQEGVESLDEGRTCFDELDNDLDGLTDDEDPDCQVQITRNVGGAIAAIFGPRATPTRVPAAAAGTGTLGAPRTGDAGLASNDDKSGVYMALALIAGVTLSFGASVAAAKRSRVRAE